MLPWGLVQAAELWSQSFGAMVLSCAGDSRGVGGGGQEVRLVVGGIEG